MDALVTSNRPRLHSLAGLVLLLKPRPAMVVVPAMPLFWFFETGLLAQVALPTGDGVTSLVLNGFFGGAALLMLWKYIQQTAKNERTREENNQRFLMDIRIDLREHTRAIGDLTKQVAAVARLRDKRDSRRPPPASS